jgi:hypothetical protein
VLLLGDDPRAEKVGLEVVDTVLLPERNDRPLRGNRLGDGLEASAMEGRLASRIGESGVMVLP